MLIICPTCNGLGIVTLADGRGGWCPECYGAAKVYRHVAKDGASRLLADLTAPPPLADLTVEEVQNTVIPDDLWQAMLTLHHRRGQ